MITTPAEYLKYLWGITIQKPLLDENGNEVLDENGKVVMVDVNPHNNVPIQSIILPSDERTYSVNLNTRTIEAPTFLSVAKDHRAETIYFLVDRYYDYKDLSETSCIIEFINAAGEGGFYVVPFYDITSYPRYMDENNVVHQAKMLIPWCIEGDVTKRAGSVQFAIRFYQLDDANKGFIYNVRTQPTTATVLIGMDESQLDANLNKDVTASLVEQINAKLDNTETTVYWTDLPEYLTSRSQGSPTTDESNAYQNSLENSNKVSG